MGRKLGGIISDHAPLIGVGIIAAAGLGYAIFGGSQKRDLEALPASPEKPVDCSIRPYCPQIHTCREAMQYLRQCDLQRLDADRDGFPCELTCSGPY